ncbi:MAG: malectin domain-containing carbohydrate-binding protein [Acidobacteriota bacterium]
MAVETPASIRFAEERAELDAVLRAAAFVRAPKLAQLLSYLCERLFAGETAQVKEYSIGVEVFGRGANFDQDSDSIVRVEANRLRKKLAEYYAGEGAGHALKIVIPVGRYVPEFQRILPPAPVELPVIAEPPPPPQPHLLHWRWPLITLAGIALLVAGFAVAWFIRRPAHHPARAVATSAPALLDGGLIGPPVGEEVHILCGAPHSMVDHAGKLWSADTSFTGGTAVKSDVQHIWRTQDQAFYRTSRQGSFTYDIPLRPGVYELHLDFAETVYGPESTGSGGEGSRIFNVTANGKPLLTRFDVVADAGASRTADEKVFTDISPAADGKLHLVFAGEDGDSATLSAIEILPGLRGRIRPVRILTRQTPYYSNDSHWWSPDAWFEGGEFASYTAPPTGTDDPDMYSSERWGNFTYAIPVAPGRYAVTLYFVARHGDWPFPSGNTGQPVRHVFNVFCNGRALLQNFDVAYEGRQTDVVVRRSTGLQPNAQGKLLLSFVPVDGYATVTGIEVQPQ